MAAPPLPPEIAPPDRVTPAPAKSARRRAPREPAVAEPAPSRVPGTVIVGVEGGWGTITVDGRASGQAPRALTLPAGRHVIEVLPFGEPPVRRQVVDVSPGGTHRVVVRP
jgi:hypothetical protein